MNFNMLKVVIIDDEASARNFIEKIITSNFKDLEVVSKAINVETGLQAIKKYSPDIVFLDVDMPDGTGFDLLQKLSEINFKVIFVTAHSEFAIKAIKFSAIDYILKPIDALELTETIIRIKKITKKEDENLKISAILNNLNNNSTNKKIVLNTSDNIYVVNTKEIVKCSSEGNYTTFHLNNRQKIIISKTLKEYENLLSDYGFIRIHRSYLININFVEKYSKEDSILHMKDNSQIPVSYRKKDELLKFLQNL